MENIKEKNKDQSDKAIAGAEFNRLVMNKLLACENLSFKFVKKEHAFKTYIIENGFYKMGPRMQVDHSMVIFNHDKKQAMYIFNDSTTTHRGQRIKEKAFEGIEKSRLKHVIANDFKERFQQYEDYELVILFIVIYPTHMSDGLKNLERERRDVHQFCVDVNYKATPLATRDGFEVIDYAAKLCDFVVAIKELTLHPSKYDFHANLLSEIWKTKYTTYKDMPPLALIRDNFENRPAMLMQSMEYYKSKESYDLAQFQLFFNEMGWVIPQNATKNKMYDITKAKLLQKRLFK